jgi:hypothetical protein
VSAPRAFDHIYVQGELRKAGVNETTNQAVVAETTDTHYLPIGLWPPKSRRAHAPIPTALPGPAPFSTRGV